ncbi:HipA domain-containing protein [Pseudoflavitalea rhizosphaerae]|uniref:HipA domain-containing protein n=1 Tax=Pseudoflavitalea rhizosphaerae TaxID=1884793 RepID=UPI000F8DBF62|nr:HipA domain-containing protein [Pseudoflavitalea rhizosphaerae]
MRIPKIKYCPCTLQEGYDTYSPLGQQQLFGSRSKKVSHILPFGPPGKSTELTREYNEKRKRISISGVQEKYSLLLKRNTLELTDKTGTHILKPIPAERLELVNDLPANEHVTMQIARHVFGIRTADCGMIFFDDGSPAYITRRFDYRPNGDGKFQVEDFAILLGKSPEIEGVNFKYDASYLDIAEQIDAIVAASSLAMVEFFKLVIFNYLVGNGDAHLKNFSLIETIDGDYYLAPAYDLLCTSLHINDGNLALSEGLYENDYEEASFSKYGYYTQHSFLKFAKRIGIKKELATKTLNDMLAADYQVPEIVNRSFMSKEGKKKYLSVFGERKQRLREK